MLKIEFRYSSFNKILIVFHLFPFYFVDVATKIFQITPVFMGQLCSRLGPFADGSQIKKAKRGVPGMAQRK